MRDEDRRVFRETLSAMAAFKHTFKRDLSPDFIAELYVTDRFALTFPDEVNHPGYDAISAGVNVIRLNIEVSQR